MREVALLASLRHPNLILFMGYATQPHLAIVSEFMHRGSLFKVLRKGGDKPLDLRLQRSVAISVARGMAYLHSRSPPLLHLVSYFGQVSRNFSLAILLICSLY